jgi:folate-dependent phosphoribosylglycinamide formyltransferase PurN
MIFARESSDGLTSLVKKIDAEVAKKNGLKAFVVFLNGDGDDEQKKVKEFQDKNGIKHVSLALDNSTGPPKYEIAKDADVTVVYYNKRKVEVNHAFKKGELTAAKADSVAADVSKIVK